MSSGKFPLKVGTQISLFAEKVKETCLSLAQMIVRDAEGATKFITLQINGAKSIPEAKKAGLCLANSVLFKCALYGASHNWGRVISALGQAGIKVRENISVKSTSLRKKDVKVTIDLKRGEHSWKVYTSDLTPKYIEINAGYN